MPDVHLYIFGLTFFIGFQLSKECLTCKMAITFSISRCQISIYVVTLFSVMYARCTLVFILFNTYSRQINHECLTCDRVPDTRYTFMCLTCSVVLDTTHLIDFNVFIDFQPKIDGKHKNEISNIVEVKKHVKLPTIRQCYLHLLRKRCRGV